MIAQVFLPGEIEPLCRMVTVLCRKGEFSVMPELSHMARSTHDPSQRREMAVQFFSSAYFQRAGRFSDSLTATFAPGSRTAARLLKAKVCRLTFKAFSQGFDLSCGVRRLLPEDPLHEATHWHNFLFNPRLHPEAEILSFDPLWKCSSATGIP